MTAFQVNFEVLPIDQVAYTKDRGLPPSEHPLHKDYNEPCQIDYQKLPKDALRGQISDYTWLSTLDLETLKLDVDLNDSERLCAHPDRFPLVCMRLMKWSDGRCALLVGVSPRAEEQIADDPRYSSIALDILDSGTNRKIAGPFPLDFTAVHFPNHPSNAEWDRAFVVPALPHERLNFVFRKI